MRHKRFVFFAIAMTVVAAGFGLARIARASGKPPDPTFAQQVTGLLTNEMVAALFQEFHETNTSTAAAGKQAISTIFNDGNRDIRLVGNMHPLLGGDNDLPSDTFETKALNDALIHNQVDTAEEKIGDTWYWRLSIPLNPGALSAACCTNNGAAGGTQASTNVCLFCHANFRDPTKNAGALMLRVAIKKEDD